MLMLCPLECREDPEVNHFIENRIVNGENPISEVVFQDLRQSMRNGGGPACLRLRVPLSREERDSISARVFLSDESASFLRDWITRHYPEKLTLADLSCFARYQSNAAAVEELREWMGLGPA
jgi:succinylarginine dihydrolase